MIFNGCFTTQPDKSPLSRISLVSRLEEDSADEEKNVRKTSLEERVQIGWVAVSHGRGNLGIARARAASAGGYRGDKVSMPWELSFLLWHWHAKCKYIIHRWQAGLKEYDHNVLEPIPLKQSVCHCLFFFFLFFYPSFILSSFVGCYCMEQAHDTDGSLVSSL